MLLDTSVLVDALCGPQRSWSRLRALVGAGEPAMISSLVLFEWRRGPRTPAELEAQRLLLPDAQALPFGTQEALLAADLYRRVSRPRGREADLAIAASAICQSAKLWTLNVADFSDIPGLKLLPRTP